MTTFLIVTVITLIVSCPGFLAVLKIRKTRLSVFYAVLTGMSLVLTTLHCFDLNPFDMLFR